MRSASPSSPSSLPLILFLIIPITRLYADNTLLLSLSATVHLSVGASALHKPCRQYRHRLRTLTRSWSAIKPISRACTLCLNLEIGAMAPVLLHSSSKAIQHSTTTLIRRLLPAIRSLVPDSTPDPSSILSTRSAQPLTISSSSLLRRQQVVAIPTTYSNINPGSNPGQIAGIVLGSVAGFILLLWLLYTVFSLGGGGSGGTVVEERVIRRRSRSPRPRSVSRSEIIEVQQVRHRSPAPPPRREVRRETIVVEETRRPAPVEREDDIVEVIEEHSPPPRRARSQRNSGYRNVDPDEYGGGDRPLRKVSRR